MWYKNVFATIHAVADRETDGQKGLCNIVCCITCSRTVKIDKFYSYSAPWLNSMAFSKLPQCVIFISHGKLWL